MSEAGSGCANGNECGGGGNGATRVGAAGDGRMDACAGICGGELWREGSTGHALAGHADFNNQYSSACKCARAWGNASTVRSACFEGRGNGNADL